MATTGKESKGFVIRTLDIIAFVDAVRLRFNESLLGFCLRNWRRGKR